MLNVGSYPSFIGRKPMSLLDDVFEILEAGTRHEKSGNRIEAATKYFEATWLMRMVLATIPQEAVDTRKLLEHKIEQYSAAANRLYFDDSSMAPASAAGRSVAGPISPMSMSQLTQQTFFQDEMTHRRPQVPASCASPRLVESAEFNKLASTANAKLENAMDLDEAGKTSAAVDMYMAAAELYLEAIRISETSTTSSSLASVLKRRLNGALDRVEQLKQLKRKRILPEVVSGSAPTSSFSKEEISVLKRSSLIASGLFLPWSDGDASALSRRVQNIRSRPLSSELYMDKDGVLPLSSTQLKHLHKWARPSEIARLRQNFGTDQKTPTMIRSVNPFSIRQKYVTDCSFIASLCICAAFEKRFRRRVITSIIYPQDRLGIPIYNPEGKYMVKLWLNGVARQVVVDDRLPIDRHSNLLCSQTNGNRNQLELWVTIIEKAYMKLCGGYDFPGSNR